MRLTLAPGFLSSLALALALLLLWWAPVQAQTAASATAPVPVKSPGAERPARVIEASVLILDVRLGNAVLSDGLTAYQDGPLVLLPLGELARLLTLAITVQPETGSASGYVLSEERTFGLNLARSVVSLTEQESTFQTGSARVIDGDIYVSNVLLSRWLPIDFEVAMSSLQLRVSPREKLPLQERLERARTGKRLGGARVEQLPDPGFARDIAPYQWLDLPFIDQTFGVDARRAPGLREQNAAYTAYLTADALGMEGAAYISSSSKQSPDWRVTLGRNDPDAGLLGPMRATSFLLGNISIPSVANVMTSSGNGRGVSVANRPLDQPTSFDRQSLRGNLPPGWDATLYYNEALVGFQSSRADGLYAFDNMPLSFGRNEFLLTFNGPLGQIRSERKSFLLDQSIVKPGEFLYALAEHRSDTGERRSIARFDVGLTPAIAGSVGLVRMPDRRNGMQKSDFRSYTQMGLRGYWERAIVSSEVTFGQRGMVADLGLKTRLAGFAVDLQHIHVQGDFDSDVFSASNNSVRMRDKLRVLGTLAPFGLLRLPVALELQRERTTSGETHEMAAGRLSMMYADTSATNALSWQRTGGTVSTYGSVQISRRMAGMGLSGLMGYSVRPEARLDSLAFTADRHLASGYRVNAGLLHAFSGRTTLVSGGLTKNFGRFALAVSASYSSQRDLTLGLQLFVALGRKPRTEEWFADAVPMAGMGAVSARAFVDRNRNGVRDPHEELVPNAGFIINKGGRHPARSSEDGTAFIGRLVPGRYTDIALDPATLEDPLWKPLTEGVRVLPRPGMVQTLEFPVISTSEVDGTVYLLGNQGRRGIGDAMVELVDSQGVMVMQTRSSSDGFYLLRHVLAGRYTLRISLEQATKLALTSTRELMVNVTAEGDFISGQDLEMTSTKR